MEGYQTWFIVLYVTATSPNVKSRQQSTKNWYQEIICLLKSLVPIFCHSGRATVTEGFPEYIQWFLNLPGLKGGIVVGDVLVPTQIISGIGASCPYCGKHINRADNLKQHIENIHIQIPYDKWPQCKICSKKYKHRRYLRSHLTSSHSIKPDHFTQYEIIHWWHWKQS